MKLLFTFFIGVCLLFFGKQVMCQNQPLSFKHLTVNDGLSVGNGNCIFKDSRGYIWISTFDGLNRFDGIECAIYKNSKKDSTSISGYVLYNILEDASSNLWIGSNEGLNFYDRKRNQFAHYFYDKNIAINKTYSPFYIDADSIIWLQSEQKIITFNPTTKKFKEQYHFSSSGNLIISTYPNNLFQKINKIVVAIKGTNEMYSSNNPAAGLEFKKMNLFLKDIDIKISSLCNDGFIQWIGTNNGLYKFVNNNLLLIPLSEKVKKLPNILAIHADKKNQLWVGTQLDGLFLIDKKGEKKLQQFLNASFNPNSLSGNQVQFIYTDNQANVWVSLWGKGIDYANTEKYTFQHHLNKLETSASNINNFIRSIVEIKSNRFWCATLLNGIVVLDENKKIIKNITKGLPATIEYIFKDSKDVIWIATLAGLFTADAKTETITKYKGFEKFTKESQQFNYIIELSDGRMLVSAEAGLFFISTNKGKNNVVPVKIGRAHV